MTRTIIITRPKPAIAEAQKVYANAGFETLAMPCFDVVTNPSIQPHWLNQSADVCVFLSVHALVHTVRINPEWQPSVSSQVIAIGPAVERAWQRHFDSPIQTHPWTNSEGVIELLKLRQPNSIQIFTTQGGRDLIQSHCMHQQISYTQFNTYLRVPLALDVAALERACDQGEVVMTATSAGVLQHLKSQVPAYLFERLFEQKLVVGSERIAMRAKSMGFEQVLVAANASDSAMSITATQ